MKGGNTYSPAGGGSVLSKQKIEEQTQHTKDKRLHTNPYIALYHVTREQGTPVSGLRRASARRNWTMTKGDSPAPQTAAFYSIPGPAQSRGFGRTRSKIDGTNRPKTRRKPSGHYEQPKDKNANPTTPNNEELSRGGRGFKVNWPRPRLEIQLRYVVFPEQTHFRCELAGTKSLVRLLSKLCSAPGEVEV